MRRILILLLLSSVYLSSLSQDFRSFIPNDYDTLDDGVARGDLNKDGIEDIVIVVGSKWEQDENWSEKASDSNVAPRLLMILFGTDSGYVQIAKNDKTNAGRGFLFQFKLTGRVRIVFYKCFLLNFFSKEKM